jgi:hypothetical protein
LLSTISFIFGARYRLQGNSKTLFKIFLECFYVDMTFCF